ARLTISRTGYLAKSRVSVGIPDTNVVVRLTEACSIMGLVRDPGGIPAKAFRIAWGREGSKRMSGAVDVSDAEGKFRIDGLAAGDHVLRAWNAAGSASSGPIAARPLAEVRTAANAGGALLVLQPLLQLSGQVVSSVDGAPIADATVQATLEGSQPADG